MGTLGGSALDGCWVVTSIFTTKARGANSDGTKENGENNESRELGTETKTSTPEG